MRFVNLFFIGTKFSQLPFSAQAALRPPFFCRMGRTRLSRRAIQLFLLFRTAVTRPLSRLNSGAFRWSTTMTARTAAYTAHRPPETSRCSSPGRSAPIRGHSGQHCDDCGAFGVADKVVFQLALPVFPDAVAHQDVRLHPEAGRHGADDRSAQNTGHAELLHQ